MSGKFVGLVHRQRAAHAADRQLHEARQVVEMALWNLRWNDDPNLGSEEAPRGLAARISPPGPRAPRRALSHRAKKSRRDFFC